MNVKDLSVTAGVSHETVRRKVNELFPGRMKRGVTTTFSKEECFKIMKSLNKKNEVEIPQDTQKSVEVVDVNQDKTIQMMTQAMVAAMQAVILPAMERLIGNSQRLLPEPVKEDYYTLVAYCSIKGITVNRSELATHGMALKKIANREGVELKKIPDERWGLVNSYTVKILDEYFAA